MKKTFLTFIIFLSSFTSNNAQFDSFFLHCDQIYLHLKEKHEFDLATEWARVVTAATPKNKRNSIGDLTAEEAGELFQKIEKTLSEIASAYKTASMNDNKLSGAEPHFIDSENSRTLGRDPFLIMGFPNLSTGITSLKKEDYRYEMMLENEIIMEGDKDNILFEKPIPIQQKANRLFSANEIKYAIYNCIANYFSVRRIQRLRHEKKILNLFSKLPYFCFECQITSDTLIITPRFHRDYQSTVMPEETKK